MNLCSIIQEEWEDYELGGGEAALHHGHEEGVGGL
jgi:hypothetical protein